MSAAARNSGGGAVCPRLKPTIYKTADGKVIVEDELLNFITVKMKTLAHDEIVLLASNNFSSEWIEESKRLLFDVCPSSQRFVKHTGNQKDVNNIKACLKVLNECGENIPRFVSHYLDELPLVGFGNMDASALLSRVEQLNREVSCLRGAMEAQATVGETLGAAAALLDRRVSAIERRRESLDRAPDNGSESTERQDGGTQEPAAAGTTRLSLGAGETTIPPPQSPLWSAVVEKRRRKSPGNKPNPAKQLQPGATQARTKRDQQKKKGIIGTSTSSNITVVKTKMVSVFATRFSPTLEAETLCAYMSDKLGKPVTCRKIDSTRNRFSSFQVTAECNEVAEMYDPQLWPDGIFVRRYFEIRTPRVNNDSSARESGRGGDSPHQRSATVITHIAALQQSNSRAEESGEIQSK